MSKFVIIGQTGDYSDNMQWLVGYTDSEERAKEFVLECEEHSRKIYDYTNTLESGTPKWEEFHTTLWACGKIKEEREQIHPLDCNFQMSHTGTMYHYEKVNNIDE